MYFIDLFAGLGGFHLALKELGCKCVFASEIKDDLRKLYKTNFPETPIVGGDITKIKPEEIPSHDILCAGFPCQPFSQAGKRQGFGDIERGNLFYNICDIVKYHRPKYILLENVANLKNHDSGHTWETIKNNLEALDYEVAEPAILSPHQFAIPQHRRRIYIVCVDKKRRTLEGFSFPKPIKRKCDIKRIIEEDDTNIIKIKGDTRHQLEVWQEFLDLTVAHGDTIPRFPIWAMEFGATYDYEFKAPAFQSLGNLVGKKGNFYVAKLVAQNTGQKVEYSKHKGLEDKKCEIFLLQSLGDHGSLTKQEIVRLLSDILPDQLSVKQKETKVYNILRKMKKAGWIYNESAGNRSSWFLVK